MRIDGNMTFRTVQARNEFVNKLNRIQEERADAVRRATELTALRASGIISPEKLRELAGISIVVCERLVAGLERQLKFALNDPEIWFMQEKLKSAQKGSMEAGLLREGITQLKQPVLRLFSDQVRPELPRIIYAVIGEAARAEDKLKALEEEFYKP